MSETEIKALVSQTVEEMVSHTSEINKCKEECEAKVAEANSALENAINEKNEIEANAQKIQEALDNLQAEWDALNKKWDELYEEKRALEQALAEAQAKERINEMNAAISSFTDDEKAYAQTEIDAFNADPTAVEINSIVNKIWEGIGKNAKAKEKAAAEQNAANQQNVEDIFSEVVPATTSDEDVNIF